MRNKSALRADKKGGMDKNGIQLSIPVKVVLLTGVTYVILWSLGTISAATGFIDFSKTFAGVRLEYLWWLLQIVGVAAAATAGTHFFLDRPLRQLARAMAKAEEGDFLIRAEVTSYDELGELAENFNKMLAKITDLSANKIQAEHDLIVAQEELKYRATIEEKGRIIERTNKNLENLVKDLSLIYEIGQEVNSVTDFDKLYTNITFTLKHYLKIEQFAVLVFDDKKEELHVKAASGFHDDDKVLKTTFRRGEGISGLVAETGKKIYIRDTSTETRFLHYKGTELKERSSFLSIPLKYKNEIFGVINYGRPSTAGFTLSDVKMLTLVANQVGLAIANAQLYSRTRELSITDELTGLHNRRYFQQMFQIEWKRAVRFGRELSSVMIDIDHFKEYNDTYLHAVGGDMVLKRIGRLLKNNLREVDTVARFGGEEFVLLLPDTDKHGALAVAEKVRKLVEDERFFTEKGEPMGSVTVSCGVSTYPDDVGEMEDLIDNADIALYKAKHNGRNRVEAFLAKEDKKKKQHHKRKPRKKKSKIDKAVEGTKTLQ